MGEESSRRDKLSSLYVGVIISLNAPAICSRIDLELGYGATCFEFLIVCNSIGGFSVVRFESSVSSAQIQEGIYPLV